MPAVDRRNRLSYEGLAKDNKGGPPMKLTRRKLATAILSSTAATVLAQTPPSTPGDELKAARDRFKAISDTLAKQTVPIETEPALQFKA